MVCRIGAALVLVLIALLGAPVSGQTQTRDLADYWPNYPMAIGHVLTPDPACPGMTIGSGANGTSWAFEFYGGSGLSFRTVRSGGQSGSGGGGSGVAYQDWVWTHDRLYVLGEISCTATRCDLVQMAPPWPLVRRYLTPTTHYTDKAYVTTTMVTGFDPSYQSPPRAFSAHVALQRVTVAAGLADRPCGGALARQMATTPYGYEEAWISDYVPICGTTDYRRGVVRWKATATALTVAQCAASGGRWEPPSGCALADASLCWQQK